MIKRIFDIILSFILIILTLPLLIILSLLIKIDSPGPILLKQKRYTKNKKVFIIFKFRTMHIDTPKYIPKILLNESDKYITSVGKILRKLSLDELPQLFNVLKGDMSLVGPRPIIINEYDFIKLRDKYNIYSIKPGITGWAQVNGRDDISTYEKVMYDKYYMEHMSIIFDIKILFLTFFKVLIHKDIHEGKEIATTKEIDT